jgi:enamine deaminase RidA (YjgF/YER057c/UK114 family)
MKRISTGSPFESAMGYSRAVVKGGWCFVSGVTGYDYSTMTISGHAGQQTRQCFKTIEAVLTEAGFELGDVVRVQYTLVRPSDLDAVAAVCGEVLAEVRPAATMVVAGLINAAMLIEIEVTAFKG